MRPLRFILLGMLAILLTMGSSSCHKNSTAPESIAQYPAGTVQSFPLGNTGLSIKMCWCPPGSFMMGAPVSDTVSHDYQRPQHTVTFARGFWISQTEVTQQQWRTVMYTNPAATYGVGDSFPIYNVSWNDVQIFEGVLHNNFRLPTEAEWEYACRAGTTTNFFWGDDPGFEAAGPYSWHLLNSAGTSQPVGQKLGNPWNIFDINGNVREWCEDFYYPTYVGAPTDGSAWLTITTSTRVLRGDCFISYPTRSANRDGAPPRNWTDFATGFRLVRDP